MKLENFTPIERKHIYISSMRPVLDRNALFSDTTSEYLTPAEPEANETISIRFRTAHNNVDEVFLVIDDHKYQMNFEYSEGVFDYYIIEYHLSDTMIHYYFEIHTGRLVNFYNKLGVTRNVDVHYNFSVKPGFHTPDWAKGAVIYQIFVDRFCNGDTTNDVEDREYYYIGDSSVQVKNWFQYPSNMDVRSFYGGDLQGVWDKLDYLQELGVEVIYFNPLFVSPSNHKYDSQDYDYIDPHYGKIVKDGGSNLPQGDNNNSHASKYITRVTSKENLEASNEFFAQLVEEIHKRGMKVILDGVFNHCGSFNKWLDRERIYEASGAYEPGAYVSKDSPYHTFFKFYEDKWPCNGTYDGWWGHDTLPKLNYEESEELYNYILNVGRKWVSAPYNVDGWRLDVAADLGHSNSFNHQFWRDFRAAVKEANPNAIILAEHYGDPYDWLQGDQWDTIMNYDAFMEPITWFLTGMEKHSDSYQEGQFGNADNFFGAMRYHMANFTTPSLQTSMNELSNHDHSRFLTRTNKVVGRIEQLGPEAANENVNPAVFREAIVMQMTWPGAPTIYYGDEVGLCGFTDPDNRRTYPWGREDMELLEFHKEIIQIHKNHEVFKTGSLKFIYGEHNLIAYSRFNFEQQAVIVINNNDTDKYIELNVWPANIPMNCQMNRLLLSTATYFCSGSVNYPVIQGRISVHIQAHSALVLYHDKNMDNQ